jgi:hypothetical protein
MRRFYTIGLWARIARGDPFSAPLFVWWCPLRLALPARHLPRTRGGNH